MPEIIFYLLSSVPDEGERVKDTTSPVEQLTVLREDVTERKWRGRRESSEGGLSMDRLLSFCIQPLKGLLSLLVPAVGGPADWLYQGPGQGVPGSEVPSTPRGRWGGSGKDSGEGFWSSLFMWYQAKVIPEKELAVTSQQLRRHYKMTGCWVSAAAEVVFSRDIGLSGITTA